MHQFDLKTPILFLVFNRPSTTKIVFETIRNARPSKLYVVADGPRNNIPGELEKCQEVRSIVTDIDWDCELKTLFRDENLGCGKGVSAGITWFFQNEPEGIILEDDCYPHPTFFRYCSELLEHYRDDNRVMEISGNNLRPEGYQETEYSYSFSNFNGIWGWASWRRAWDLYDFEMKEYKNVRQRRALDTKYTSIYERDYFTWVFERTYLFPHITWDYQWEFVKRINSALTIVPKKNLVINLGFGADATSTTSSDGPAANLKSEAFDFPLIHPPYVLADVEGDNRAFRMYMTTVKSRLISHIKALLPQKVREQLFKKSMIRFIKSQTSDPDQVRQLREKSPSKLFFFSHLALTLNALEFELEFIFLMLI
jgi:hypothetical protein